MNFFNYKLQFIHGYQAQKPRHVDSELAWSSTLPPLLSYPFPPTVYDRVLPIVRVIILAARPVA
jgi:hypothetical protein